MILAGRYIVGRFLESAECGERHLLGLLLTVPHYPYPARLRIHTRTSMKFNFAIRSNPIQSTHTTPFLSTTKQPVRITNNGPIKSRHDLIFYRSMAMAMATDISV